MPEPFKVLFYTNGSPIESQNMKRLISRFGQSYKKTVKKIITNSTILSKDAFRLNVATLLPSFGMTRRGAFHGLKIVGTAIRDPDHIIDLCWTQVGGELLALKEIITEKGFDQRSRAMLELSPDSRNYVVEKISELFEKLKWISVSGSYVGRVGASKILFAVLPEICLPVDNAEWDYVFRTDDYHKVLLTMIDEINEWEAKTHIRFESLDSPPTTLPSVYNVMAMAARPNADASLDYPRHIGSTDRNRSLIEPDNSRPGFYKVNPIKDFFPTANHTEEKQLKKAKNKSILNLRFTTSETENDADAIPALETPSSKTFVNLKERGSKQTCSFKGHKINWKRFVEQCRALGLDVCYVLDAFINSFLVATDESRDLVSTPVHVGLKVIAEEKAEEDGALLRRRSNQTASSKTDPRQ